MPDLRQKFLDVHEHSLGSSLGTVRRYRAATRHLEEYAARHARPPQATDLRVGEVVRLLIEESDLDGGWLRVRNKTALGWRVMRGAGRRRRR